MELLSDAELEAWYPGNVPIGLHIANIELAGAIGYQKYSEKTSEYAKENNIQLDEAVEIVVSPFVLIARNRLVNLAKHLLEGGSDEDIVDLTADEEWLAKQGEELNYAVRLFALGISETIQSERPLLYSKIAGNPANQMKFALNMAKDIISTTRELVEGEN